MPVETMRRWPLLFPGVMGLNWRRVFGRLIIVASSMNANDASQTPAPEPKGEREPMLYCPVCDTRLTESRCKLVCAKCAYYMSCADYY